MLCRFKPGERAAVEDAIAQAAQAVLVWVRQGIEACMNRFNGEPKPEKPKKEKPAKDKTDKTTRTGDDQADDATTRNPRDLNLPCQ